MSARLSGVRYRFPEAEREALAGVDLELRPGELTLLAGASGSGKSTALRALCGLVPHFHGGHFAGRASVGELDTRTASIAAVCARAGIVFQDPEAGAVMQTAEREVAFALENAGWPASDIAARGAQALEQAGAGDLGGRKLTTLSGGELQRVALAAALAPRPRLLLLDEPTSQLDAAGADELAARLRSLCDRDGVAIAVADHRTERLAAVADRVVQLAGGRVVAEGTAAEVPLPPSAPPPLAEPRTGGEPLAELVAVEAGYGLNRVLRGASLSLRAGSVTALVGPNGSGKTTVARVLAGLHEAADGRVLLVGDDVTDVPAERRFPRIGYVGQDPGRYLLHERVDDEVGFALGLLGRASPARVDAELRAHGLARHATRHPRDLSGGERERVALASVLVADPRVLVLDEPTRGMDVESRARLVALLRAHADGGGAALLITHDAGVAAAAADSQLRMDAGRIR